MMTRSVCTHQEAWLSLPWLANGRLSQPERASVEEHVRECAACTQELAREQLLCEALTEPDRVTYAPGPSFRKLLERIDGEPAAPRPHPAPRRAWSTVAAGSIPGLSMRHRPGRRGDLSPHAGDVAARRANAATFAAGPHMT